jgi:hypothetical protein
LRSTLASLTAHALLCGALSIGIFAPIHIALAADAEKAHPHQGIMDRFPPTPPKPEIDTEQRAALARDESVLLQTEKGAGGRGTAIQDIHATPEVVMARIRDFDAYPRMVDHVSLCEVYDDTDDGLVRVRFIIGVFGIDYEYFIEHTFHPAPSDGASERYVTWTLDYSRESDLDDSVGYWYVIPHPEKPGWSRLFYSIDMRTRGWMPGFIRNLIADKGLRDATSWVKRESEKGDR